MSYYMMDYSMTNPGTPGWQFAPVPGWGANPQAAGPSRVGVGCSCAGPVGQDTRVATDIEGRYNQTSYGMVAAVGAGALLLGVFLGYVAGKRAQKKLTSNRRRRRSARRNPTYYFEWKGGGYNTVTAKDKREAMRKARELGAPRDVEWGNKTIRTKGLTPIAGSFRAGTPQQIREWERKWAGMYDNNPSRGRTPRARQRSRGMKAKYSEYDTVVEYTPNVRWSQRYKNQLPDSAFLYVAPGGRKMHTKRGTITIPRSKRKLPVKDLQGRYNKSHLANAIARLGQAKTQVPQKKKLQTKAQRIYSREFGYAKAPRRALPRAA